MFSEVGGPTHTYFADSPVVIDISGLYWGNPVTSPFTVVRVEVIRPVTSSSVQTRARSASRAQSTSYSPSEAAQLLAEMFTNSNAAFYDESIGYINGAEIKQVTDSDNITHNMLVVTSYTDLSLTGIDEEEGDLSIYDAEGIMSYDYSTGQYIVELDSTQERCDTLLDLCSIAYGSGQGGSGGDSSGQGDSGGGSGEQDDTTVSDDDIQIVGDFRADTGGQTSVSFDISSALRAIWSGYDFNDTDAEVAKAKAALTGSRAQTVTRAMRTYILRIYTEYLDSSDGEFTTTQCSVLIDGVRYTDIPGGQCLMGGMTEWERSLITDSRDRDVSHFEHTGIRNGDASTKPTSSPERVGKTSITSWVDVSNAGTQSIFYSPTYNSGQGQSDGTSAHAPLVLRDTSQEYVDFLFLNRRGAVETCSGQTLESMGINVKVTQYSRTSRPSFNPVRSLMAIGQDGRRSWQMSSGFVSREWAEWWALEFLGGKRKQWWMRYPIGDANGTYVPVIVEPSKQNISIYDRSKQNMPHVDFTVTLALEG